MALISTIKVPAVLSRAEPLHESTVMNSALGQSSPLAKWVLRRAHGARGASWVLRGFCYVL